MPLVIMKREKTLYDHARNSIQYQLNQYARSKNFSPSLMRDMKCQVGHVRSCADLLDEFLEMKGLRHADVQVAWQKSIYNNVRWQVIAGDLGVEWKKYHHDNCQLRIQDSELNRLCGRADSSHIPEIISPFAVCLL